MANLDRLKEESKRLSEEGIIRPVTQPTDWLFNMLVKEKTKRQTSHLFWPKPDRKQDH